MQTSFKSDFRSNPPSVEKKRLSTLGAPEISEDVAGPRFGLEGLVSNHHEEFVRIAASIVQCRDDAIDVVQSTYLYFLAKRPTYGSLTRSYLCRSVANRARDMLRRKKALHRALARWREELLHSRSSPFPHSSPPQDPERTSTDLA